MILFNDTIIERTCWQEFVLQFKRRIRPQPDQNVKNLKLRYNSSWLIGLTWLKLWINKEKLTTEEKVLRSYSKYLGLRQLFSLGAKFWEQGIHS